MRLISVRRSNFFNYLRTLILENFPNEKFTCAQLAEVSAKYTPKALDIGDLSVHMKKLCSDSETLCPLKNHSFMHYIRKDAQVEAGTINDKDTWEVELEAVILDCIAERHYVTSWMIILHAQATSPAVYDALTERFTTREVCATLSWSLLGSINFRFLQ